MTEYTIGTMRQGGKARRYLRIKSDEPIHITDPVVGFVREQQDKRSTYECIIGDMLRQAQEGGFFYVWYEVDSVLVETDHTPPVSAQVASMAPGVEAAAVAFTLMAEAGQIDAVTAGERGSLFSEWAAGVSYSAGQLRRRGGALYKCLQAHTAQEGWEPESVPALWKLAYDPAEEWPEWSQPICAADAYGQGDRVSWQGERWTSDVDDNVWAPGVYGWGRAENDEGGTTDG